LIAGLLGWLCVNSLQGADPFQPFRGVTFTERTDVWQFVLSEVAQRPLKGAGFASFWDINPMVQPSLQTDLWFVQPETPTNEAHNGYLDLLVSTGFVGLTLSVIVLLRWIGLGLSLLRQALRSKQSSSRAQLPYLVFLAFFPILIAAHNFLESSYFNTIGLFSFMVVFMGIEVDQRYPKPPVWLRSELWLKRR
jgi:O-antigen ligase